MQISTDGNKHVGILKELISTPFIKDMLRVQMRSMVSKDYSHCKPTNLWQDPELTLALIATLPALINSGIHTVFQLVSEMGDKFSPRLLVQFTTSLVDDINQDSLKACGQAINKLATDAWRNSPELKQSIMERGPGIIAESINAITTRINDLSRDDPQSIGTFVSDVISNLDTDELSDAAQVMAHALLDLKLFPILPWSGKLLITRLRKRFAKLI
ncbi:MAG: hypothetical protein JW920_07640 [Deltaproteobacteria bacterium]|nr:hypothetical protein [Deltaproteobacteria bacterium]